MSTADSIGHSPSALPVTLPITTSQYSDLVDHGHFDRQTGQIELINGRIVKMNPQGPQHSDPIDRLGEWSFEQARKEFRIRIEKPIVISESASVPEPDIAWVTRKSYAKQHPQPTDVLLLIEASVTSTAYDLGEKLDLYARSGIVEYWQLSIPEREIRVHRDPSLGLYRSVTTYANDQSVAPACLPSAKLRVSGLFD